MFCSKCGNQINDDAVFCPKCGNKIQNENSDSVIEIQENVVVKTKKECVHDGICGYLRRNPLTMLASFGELENYEEGKDGMVYAEIIATTKDMFGKTKNTRYGAVILEVEQDGNCVFRAPGPQLMTPLTSTKTVKKLLRFKSN